MWTSPIRQQKLGPVILSCCICRSLCCQCGQEEQGGISLSGKEIMQVILQDIEKSEMKMDFLLFLLIVISNNIIIINNIILNKGLNIYFFSVVFRIFTSLIIKIQTVSHRASQGLLLSFTLLFEPLVQSPDVNLTTTKIPVCTYLLYKILSSQPDLVLINLTMTASVSVNATRLGMVTFYVQDNRSSLIQPLFSNHLQKNTYKH